MTCWLAVSSSATGNVATDAIWDAAGDLAVGTGANTAAKLTIGAATTALKSNGTTAIWELAILGITRYAPGSDTTIGTTTSGTQADVDATNAKVTFTAPASGNVIVRVACAGTNGSSANSFIGLREGSTDIAGPMLVTSANTVVMVVRDFYLTGISAGSHTYKAAFSTASGTFSLFGGPTYGPIEMTVWAA